jgi:hypothetical protein
MSDHTNLPTCDWCLRPLAPEGVSWDDVDDPEGYCWGDEQQGCACASAHEEAWPKMLAEVARLRRDLRDSQNYRIEAAHDRGIEIERLRGLLGEAIECLQEFVCDDEQDGAPPDTEQRAQLEAFLVGLLGDRLDPGCLRLVNDTLVHGEHLRSLAERSCTDGTVAARQQAYERLKRRHSRTITTMRDLLTGLRCADEAPALP